MKKCGVFLFSMLVWSQLFGQVNFIQTQTDTARFSLSVSSKNYLQSNFLTNQSLFAIFSGNELDENIQQRQLNALKENNKFIAETQQQLGFQYKVNSKLHLGFSVSDRLLSYGAFSPDAIALVLKGNKQFENDVASFSTAHLHFSRFQSYTLKAVFQPQPSRFIHFGIGYLNGEQLLDFSASGSGLEVGPLGTNLTLFAVGELWQSDTANIGAFKSNGRGITGEIAFEGFFNPEDPSKGSAKIYVKDFAFINWSDQSVNYKVNEQYEYKGVFVENVTNYPPSIFQDQSPDTILQDIIQTGNKASNRNSLPVRYGFVINKSFKEATETSFGAEFRHVDTFLPLVFARHQKTFKNGLFAHANTYLGGMGIFGLGGGVGYQQPNWSVMVSSQQLDGLILPAYRQGVNLFLQANYRLP